MTISDKSLSMSVYGIICHIKIPQDPIKWQKWEFVILQNYLSETENSNDHTSDKKFQIFPSSYMGSFVSFRDIPENDKSHRYLG